MKNIIKHALITGVLCLSLCSVMFAQENGYVYWCSNDSLTSSPSSGAYFATDKFKKGSRVQLNVNGISKEYTVTDLIKDKNALCAVSASDAKTMGFYYTQKEMCRDLGITEQTFTQLKNKHPEIQQAISEGEALLLQDLFSALKRKAVGYKEKTTSKAMRKKRTTVLRDSPSC